MDNEAIVQKWHGAVNARDDRALADCLAEDVALGGPRDVRSGRQEAIDWVHRSGIQITPENWHPVDDRELVVEERATWPNNDDSVLIYVRYRVEGGMITAIRRFTDLEVALRSNE